jgi:formylglycine-generating enzyme
MPPRTFGPLSTARYAVSGVAFDTIRVPPGRFVDGEGLGKRTLLISRPFEIGMTLVTQALWLAVTGESPSQLNWGWPDCRVDQVSWNDAQDFLGQLESLGLRGFRLPTEAEWVWAARCGASTQWAGADRFKPVAAVNQYTTAPVGGLLPSAAGAFDLSGNVLEWQQDRWSNTPAAGVDVQGPASGYDRIGRGGGWFGDPQYVRVVIRDFIGPGVKGSHIGVRLLRSTP